MLIRDHRGCTLYSPGHPDSEVWRNNRSGFPKIKSAALLAIRIQREDPIHARPFLERIEKFAIFAPLTNVLRGIWMSFTREPLGLGGSGLSRAIESMIDRVEGNFGPFDLEDVWELIESAEDILVVPSSEAGVTLAEDRPGGLDFHRSIQ